MSMPWTSLPNLHPALVHLPLGLLPLAFVVDVASLVARRSMWLDRAASMVYLVGAAGAGAAVWAGQRAADSLVDVPARVQPVIGAHSDWGHYVWYLFGVLALVRTLVAWLDRRGESATRLPLRALLVVVALGALLVLARAADMGGALVYRYGLGVELYEDELVGEVPARATAPTLGEDAEVRLELRADGVVSWRPIPPDFMALGQVVEVAHGTRFEALGPSSPGTAVAGLPLAIDGRVVLRLPGVVGDVQVDAEIELESFEGTVGVAHHLSEPSGGGFFLLATGGDASLIDARDGAQNILDQQAAQVPEGIFKISVSSSGRHLKGMIDGETVTHGHVAAPAPGGCGLLLEGTGVLWIHGVTVTPLES